VNREILVMEVCLITSEDVALKCLMHYTCILDK